MTPEDIARLTRLIAEQDRHRLARADAKVRRVAEAQNDLAQAAQGQSDAMQIVGADDAWWRWLRRRQAALSAQAAMAAAEREDALAVTRRSTGRELAVEALRTEAANEARLRDRRKAADSLVALGVLRAALHRRDG